MFRHPTLREGFSAFMASSPNWLEIFISGLDDDGILTQLDCGSGDTRGTLIAIPPTLYRAVAERVAKARDLPRPSSWENRWERYGRWSAFLANRCSADFLKLYLEVDQQALGRCLSFGSYLSAIPELPVLAKLHQCGLLSEENHRKIVLTISKLAVKTQDADWLRNPDVKKLLTDEDRAEILAHVKDELIPDLENTLEGWELNEQGDSADGYYRPLEDALKTYVDAFKDDEFVVDALQDALQRAGNMRLYSSHWDNDEDDSDPDAADTHVGSSGRMSYNVLDRDVFEDVDE